MTGSLEIGEIFQWFKSSTKKYLIFLETQIGLPKTNYIF